MTARARRTAPARRGKRSASGSPLQPRARRSPCPVAATLDLIGDKWTLLVIRDLFAGKSRYRDLASSPERIATNILAARLERLLAGGLVAAHASPQRSGSFEYRLTARGRSLMPILVAVRDWGLTHMAGTAAKVAVAAHSAGSSSPAAKPGLAGTRPVRPRSPRPAGAKQPRPPAPQSAPQSA